MVQLDRLYSPTGLNRIIFNSKQKSSIDLRKENIFISTNYSINFYDFPKQKH